jgi:hypothetical protein
VPNCAIQSQILASLQVQERHTQGVATDELASGGSPVGDRVGVAEVKLSTVG